MFVDFDTMLSVVLNDYSDWAAIVAALENVLQQEVDFNIEVLAEKVSEEVPREFEVIRERFPKIIKLVDKVGFGEGDQVPIGKYVYYLNGSTFVGSPSTLMEFVRFHEDGEKDDIMVSISMTAYNQEKYIARALESILMQEVNFKYEIIVGEDCSTDNTRYVIEQYRKKYPDIIKPIYHPKNVGLRINNDMVRRRLRGKYRAILEGDDYWYSTDKMQTQVDFLEKHPEFIGISGNYIDVDKNGNLLSRPNSHIYSSAEIFDLGELEKWKMPSNTLALMHRNIFRDCSEEFMRKFEETQIIGDRKLYTFLLMFGDIYHSSDCVAVRMVMPASPTSWAYAQRHSNMCPITHKWLTNAENVAVDFNKKLDLTEKKIENYAISVKCFLKNPSKRNLNAVREVYANVPRKQRGKYRNGAVKECFRVCGNLIKGKGFFRAVGNIIVTGFKFIGNFFKHAFSKAQSNDAINKFI